jgi:hypothetical protein
MGPKKKAGGKDDEEDTSTRDLLYIYRKNCKELEIPSCKMFESKINEVLEEDGHLPEILINDKIGELGMRALASALMKTK